MAGAGYKLFNTGDVLTAAQVNTYLQEQTVMVFASSTARTTALSGVLAEGMMSYLQDTNAVEVYNGTSWVNVGNAGDITEVQAGVGISIASGTGPIPVITNSSTDLITTAGDILYGTAADTVARLGIGTAGQVLKVNSGATAPEWGAAAAGAMTLIKASTSFSNVANTGTTFDNIFSSTYNTYLVVVENVSAGTSTDTFRFRFLESGVVYSSGDYNGNTQFSSRDSSSVSNNPVLTQTSFILAPCGSSTNQRDSHYTMTFTNVGVAKEPQYYGHGNYGVNTGTTNFGYVYFGGAAHVNPAKTFTGLQFFSSSSNITGNVAVYGLAKA